MKILGLELPYLLEKEKAEIEMRGNILKIPEDFYKSDVSKQIEQLSKAMSLRAITAEQARILLGVKKNET